MACFRADRGLRALLLAASTWLGACEVSDSDPAKDGGEADADAEDAGDDHDSHADAGSGGDAQVLDSGGDVTCDVVPPTSCPTPPVRYGDVVPIFEERCYSCHDGLGDQWPLTTYSHVAGWATELKVAMSNCAMPPADAGIDMPAKEREKILAWLVCGLPR